MSQSHPRPSHAKHEARPVSGGVLASLLLLVTVAAVGAPWVAKRVFTWHEAPVVAIFFAMLPALYLWFRVGQQAKRSTALVTAAAYAALAAVALGLWRGS